MRELIRVGPVQAGECRVLRRGAAVEVSQGVPIRVSSWRERGGQRWLCICLSAHSDPETGMKSPELEVYVPVDVFEQRAGRELPGDSRAYVAR
jgi:hypothetical protein